MTKSTITRERLEQLADNNAICKVSWDERIELAQIALAAMDSEPVAEVVSIYGDPEAFGEREIRPLVGIQQMPYGTKLYRHAQLAPASPVCTCPSGDGSLRWPCPVHPGNSPVIPDGYVMVPKEPTKEMINAGWLYYMGTKNPSSKGTYKAMLAAIQQEGK
ncbi:TPA: hypothetical protein ACWXDK_001632 [Klebsiella pneumoniae]